MDNKDSSSLLSFVAILLTAIGAINWGTKSVFDLDLVASILGTASTPAKLVYNLVGISGLGTLILLLGGKIKY